MNLSNIAKRCLAFVLAVTISMPGFASDSSLRFNTVEQVNKSTGASRHNFFIGYEKPQDGTSAVYNSPLVTNDFPNMPYFAPYHPNGTGKADERINNGITSFPVVIRLPGNLFGGNLPYSLRQQLTKDGILSANLTLGVVAQNIPFTDATQLCFRPHTFIYPEATATMPQGKKDNQTVEFGIFESERNQAQLYDPQTKITYGQNTTHSEEISVHPNPQGDTLLSHNNMHLLGVSSDKPDSFYTYTRYADHGPKAVVCLHLLMNDAQHDSLQRLSNLSLSTYLSICNFRKVLVRKNSEFKDFAALSRIIGLLNHPVKFVVPSAKPTAVPAPQAAPRLPIAVAQIVAPQTPAAPVQTATSVNIDLVGFSCGLGQWAFNGKSTANGFLYVNGPNTVEIRPKPFVTGASKEAEIDVLWNGTSYPSIRQELKPVAPVVSNLPLTYNPKTSLKKYIEDLNKHARTLLGAPEHLEFECNLPPVGMDPFRLVFKRGGLIEYYDYRIAQTRMPSTTTAHVLYRFKYKPGDIFGDALSSQSDPIFHIPHVRIYREIVPNIMWVNDRRELMEVSHAKYKTIPDDATRKWLTANKRASDVDMPESYATTEYDLDNPYGYILDPHVELADDLQTYPTMTPTLDELPSNQYLRFKSALNPKESNYIYSDGSGRLFLATKNHCFYASQDVAVHQDGSSIFNDGSQAYGVGRKRYSLLMAVAQRTSHLISLPKNGQTFGNGFVRGFYRLNGDINDSDKSSQTWITPNSSEAMTVICKNLRQNGAYANIPGFTNLRPNYDGSVNLSELKNGQYEDLMDYLTTFYWLERKTPKIEFRFQGKDEDRIKEASINLNKLLKELPGAILDLDACYYLEQALNSDVGVLRSAQKFAQRNHNLDVIWRVAGSMTTLASTISSVGGIREIKWDFGQQSWALTKTIVEIDQIEKISQEDNQTSTFSATGDLDAETVYAKYIAKVRRLSTLKLPGFKSCMNDMLYFGLEANAATLTHLDLSGAKNLKGMGDRFVGAIRHMKQLKFLGLIKTDLHNSHTKDLVKVLMNAEYIQELKISMPYWPSTALEMNKRLVIDRWMVTKDTKDAVFNSIFTVMGIGLSPFKLCDDILGDQGTDYVYVCEALGLIAPLQKLTVKIHGFIAWNNWTERQIRKSRKDASNDKPLAISFEN